MSSNILKKLKEKLASKEEQDKIKDYFEKINLKRNIINSQLDRLHNSNKVDILIEKTIIKYNSLEYRNRWFNRGIEPPEHLFTFLFDYSLKYGRKTTQEEWNKYSNVFTTELTYCNNYYFNLMNGQGSSIKLIKK
jgi:hypothetical protein